MRLSRKRRRAWFSWPVFNQKNDVKYEVENGGVRFDTRPPAYTLGGVPKLEWNWTAFRLRCQCSRNGKCGNEDSVSMRGKRGDELFGGGNARNASYFLHHWRVGCLRWVVVELCWRLSNREKCYFHQVSLDVTLYLLWLSPTPALFVPYLDSTFCPRDSLLKGCQLKNLKFWLHFNFLEWRFTIVLPPVTIHLS